MDNLVSVIVPIYNNEKVLKRCVDSIVNQTYKKIEIILIDDGSTDDSFKICNEYLKNDKRIKIIHKENGGVSQTRNIGLKEAKGTKLVFIDSDDYVDKTYIECLMKYRNADLVICGYFTVNEKKSAKYIIKNNVFMNKKELLKNLTKKSHIRFYSVPYLKLFDRKIIEENNILFNEKIEYGEDACFVYEYISNINNLQIINQPLYYNDISSQDSLSRKKRKNVWNEMYEVFKAGYKIYQEDYYKYRKQISELYLKSAKTTLNSALKYGVNKEQYVELCDLVTNIKEFKEVKITIMPLYDMIVLILLKTKRYSTLMKIMQVK